MFYLCDWGSRVYVCKCFLMIGMVRLGCIIWGVGMKIKMKRLGGNYNWVLIFSSMKWSFFNVGILRKEY